jgi:hypothetical protein
MVLYFNGWYDGLWRDDFQWNFETLKPHGQLWGIDGPI